MFDSLDERIKIDEAMPPKKRLIEVAVILAISVVLFGGLYMAIRLME